MVLEIDGSHGEGGGQILRGAVSLSCLTGKGFRIYNIRSRRPNPGLQPQHLASIEAAARVAGAKVEGLKAGSGEVNFQPGLIKGGAYSFDIGTAGSVTLVAQTLMPILALAAKPSEVSIGGGTDVPWSPPVDYVRHVLLPSLRAFGIDADLELVSRGHYPKGGGKVLLRVNPCGTLRAVRAVERGQLRAVRGISHCSNLPAHVARRQADGALQQLRKEGIQDLRIAEEVAQSGGGSPGSGLTLWADTGGEIVLGADSLGAREKSAEDVGSEAAGRLLAELHSGMAADQQLGDMAVIYMGMAKGASELGISAFTQHARTMVWLSEMFLDITYGITDAGRGSSMLKVNGAGLGDKV